MSATTVMDDKASDSLTISICVIAAIVIALLALAVYK
jgi:hypothetical protein